MRTCLVLLLSFLSFSCVKKPVDSASNEQTLKSKYGDNVYYLWNAESKSVEDGKTYIRSCWYYREVQPHMWGTQKRKDGSTYEFNPYLESQQLNTHAIHDDHVQDQLAKIITEKFQNIGSDIVPCGIAGVSFVATVGSIFGGVSAFASAGFFVSTAWLANNCVKNVSTVQRYAREIQGSRQGKVSIAKGEARIGAEFAASKAETDIILEAIKRAKIRGHQSGAQCPVSNKAAARFVK